MKWVFEAACCGLSINSENKSWVFARRKLGIITLRRGPGPNNEPQTLFPLQCWSMEAVAATKLGATRFATTGRPPIRRRIKIGTVPRNLVQSDLLPYTYEGVY